MDSRASMMTLITGSAFSFAFVVALGWLQSRFEWDPLTLWVNLILPVGAIFCGLIGAIGFNVGARVFDPDADGLLLGQMIAVSAASFVGIFSLQYETLTVNGVPVSSQTGFGDFLAIRLTHAAMKVGITRIELGSAGFLLPLGNFLGYLGGAYLSFANVRHAQRAAAIAARF